SLGNAIGIHEPPFEMYGKVMSISDEMMWRYYELLTDVSTVQMEALKVGIMTAERHPMEIKKSLAQLIVTDFHSREKAAQAAKDWAEQFQQGGVPKETELVQVPLAKVNAVGSRDLEDQNSYFPLDDPKLPGIRLVWFDKVLAEAGLVSSRTEGSRKIE